MGNNLMIDVVGLRKKYTLGNYGVDTLQSAIKAWKEERAEKGHAESMRKTFYALDDISFSVKQGETLGIIGRNGAGKSTLLKIISRITAPTEGYVDLYGSVASMLEVGIGFHGDMTGRENIYLNGAILGMTKAEIDAKIADIIRFSELEKFIDTPVKRYSSGMFVRLGFSVATHLESKILIMDEVLATGDMDFQKKCVNHLLDKVKNEDRTILYVSHNMNSIRQLCDRCIVLDQGRITFDGAVEKAISVYLGTNNIMPSKIAYGKEYRPYYSGVQLRMISMILREREAPVYTSEEEACIEVACEANARLERVAFRFEFWAQDGTKMGTMLTGNHLDFEKGQCQVRMRLPLRQFTPGDYQADLIAFQFDDQGLEYKIDGVYPGFLFHIERALDHRNYLIWNHQYWGPVRMDDMKVEIIP
ncbi:MAG: ABC transporter ATP-binding protein [Clostridia bacterium]|nr:ABC transporter ATP-binding protein [Clostridia bacterium]